MKKTLMICSTMAIMLLSSGCMAKEDSSKRVVVKKETLKDSNMQGEAIVVFKEGVTLDEAKEILKRHNAVVSKEYKSLSKQNNRLYLSVRSPESSDMLVKGLQNDNAVYSVSANRKNNLY